MLLSAVTYGRVLARALVTGLTPENQRFSSQVQQKTASASQKPCGVHLVTAAAGFAKSSSVPHINKKWGYGDDAYFIERHKTASVIGGFSFQLLS